MFLFDGSAYSKPYSRCDPPQLPSYTMDPRYCPVRTKPPEEPVQKSYKFFSTIKSVALYVPWFICVVGFVQTVIFIVDKKDYLFNLLQYSPDDNAQPWRYVSYMLLHRDSTHLIINLVIQTVVAIPLEVEQGVLRSGLIYILGGLAGSLGTAVLDPELKMVGASAGIYALLMAHLPNILYNYELVRYKWYRVLSVVCLCAGDVSDNALRCAGPLISWASHVCACDVSDTALRCTGPVISWAAHLSGAAAGLLLGLTVFLSYSGHHSLAVPLLRYAAVILFTILFLFSLLYVHTRKNKAILH